MVKNTEDSNEAIVIRRDGGDSTGVIVHGMLSKGFRRNLGGPMLSSGKGVLEAEETRPGDEA